MKKLILIILVWLVIMCCLLIYAEYKHSYTPIVVESTTDTIPVKVTYYFTSGLTYCEERTANGLVALSPDLMAKYKCGDSILLEVPNTHFNGYYIISDMTAKGKVNTVDVYLTLDKGVWLGNIIKNKEDE